MKAAQTETSPTALNANQAGFVVSVAPAGVSDKGATSFRGDGGHAASPVAVDVSGPSAGQRSPARRRPDSDVADVRRRGRAGDGARRATGDILRRASSGSSEHPALQTSGAVGLVARIAPFRMRAW